MDIDINIGNITEEDIKVYAVCILNSLVPVFEQIRDDPIPQHTSILTEALYTEEILGTRNPAAFLIGTLFCKQTYRTDADIRNFNKIQRLINLFGTLYFDPIQCIQIQCIL